MMTSPPSNKNIFNSTSKAKLFTDKDNIKFQKIMSTRNLIKQKFELKYSSNDIRKNIGSHSNKNINNLTFLNTTPNFDSVKINQTDYKTVTNGDRTCDFKINSDLFKKFLDEAERKASAKNQSKAIITQTSSCKKIPSYKFRTTTQTKFPSILSQIKNPNLITSHNLKIPRPKRLNSAVKIDLNKSSEISERNIIMRFNLEQNAFTDKLNKNIQYMTENNQRLVTTTLAKEIKYNSADIIDAKIQSQFSCKMTDYVVGKEIGKGAYAIVKQCIHRPTGLKLAIKIYDKYKLLDSQRKSAAKREINVLKNLYHKNILKLYEVIEGLKQVWIVTELIEGVSLLSYVKSFPLRQIDENKCKYIFTQIIDGLNYLHSMNISHRDIKLENIIIDDKNLIKIIDFGFGTCCNKIKLLNFFCGTPSYMPPEIIQKKEYLGFNADVWSVGILLFTLLCGAFPFRGMNEKELYNKIVRGAFLIPDHVSVEAKDLIRKILTVNPNNRLDMDKIRLHEWLISK